MSIPNGLPTTQWIPDRLYECSAQNIAQLKMTSPPPSQFDDCDRCGSIRSPLLSSPVYRLEPAFPPLETSTVQRSATNKAINIYITRKYVRSYIPLATRQDFRRLNVNRSCTALLCVGSVARENHQKTPRQSVCYVWPTLKLIVRLA